MPCLLVLTLGGLRGAHADEDVAARPPRLASLLAEAKHGKDVERRVRAVEQIADRVAREPARLDGCLPGLRRIVQMRGPREQAAVMALLGPLGHPEGRRMLLAALDPRASTNEAVWSAAMSALAQDPSPDRLVRELIGAVRALEDAPPARALLLEALGPLPGPAVRRLLIQGRDGEMWVEAAGRARALQHLAGREAVVHLLDLLDHEALAVRVQAFESLQARTRQALPFEVKAWRAWWATQDGRSPHASSPADADATEEETRYAETLPRHVPRYYGVPIPRHRSRVVFCLDVSQSMYGDGIAQASEHLVRAMHDLPSTHAFEVVAFNERILPFAERIVAAHPVQKWRAIRWLGQQETTSYTNLYDAVETAFQHMGRGRKPVADPQPLDMVFLLSDGNPNRGRFRAAKRVIKHIRLLADEVPVHTVAAGERVHVLLQKIAEATGGTFTDAFE